jgi:hypothetical protein
VLPRGSVEPPPRYVAFVARHLGPLRMDSTRLVGDPDEAEHFYPLVLADVAVRWRWLELLRTWGNRPDAADAYLDRAFTSRSQRWQSEQWELTSWTDVEVYGTDVQRPVWTSSAVRLAPQVRPVREAVAWSPISEAAVAWWHAYETRRRNRRIAIVVVIVLLLAALSRFTHDDSAAIDAYHRPARMIVAGIDSFPSMYRGLSG